MRVTAESCRTVLRTKSLTTSIGARVSRASRPSGPFSPMSLLHGGLANRAVIASDAGKPAAAELVIHGEFLAIDEGLPEASTRPMSCPQFFAPSDAAITRGQCLFRSCRIEPASRRVSVTVRPQSGADVRGAILDERGGAISHPTDLRQWHHLGKANRWRHTTTRSRLFPEKLRGCRNFTQLTLTAKRLHEGHNRKLGILVDFRIGNTIDLTIKQLLEAASMTKRC